jgi:hypothetical protein
MPVVGFVHVGPAGAIVPFVAAFRKGLNETGYVEGHNVTVEYRGLEAGGPAASTKSFLARASSGFPSTGAAI